MLTMHINSSELKKDYVVRIYSNEFQRQILTSQAL